MNSSNLIEHPAPIPTFDWHVPEFLAFYIAAFVLAAFWSIRRGSASLKRFENHGTPQTLTDPFQIAYLVGGTRRVFQLALGRLLKLKLVEWKKRWNTDYVVVTGLLSNTPLHPLEADLLARLQKKKKGLALPALAHTSSPQYDMIETLLGAAGLRPTQRERNRTKRRIAAPLFALLGIGIIKLFTRVERDCPIESLVGLIVLTLILALCINENFSSKWGHLTDAGKQTLEALRANRSCDLSDCSPHSDLDDWAIGAALIGVAAMEDIAPPIRNPKRQSPS